MDIKFATVAAAVLLIGGCAQNATVKPPAEPDVSAPIAATGAQGSSTTMAQTSAGAPKAWRTRDEVHAEAVQTVKDYKSTMTEDLEYFLTH